MMLNKVFFLFRVGMVMVFLPADVDAEYQKISGWATGPTAAFAGSPQAKSGSQDLTPDDLDMMNDADVVTLGEDVVEVADDALLKGQDAFAMGQSDMANRGKSKRKTGVY